MGIKPVNKRSVSKTTTKKLSQNEIYKLSSPEERYKLKLKIEQNKKQSSTPKRVPQQRLTTTTTKMIIAPLTTRTKPRRPNSY